MENHRIQANSGLPPISSTSELSHCEVLAVVPRQAESATPASSKGPGLVGWRAGRKFLYLLVKVRV